MGKDRLGTWFKLAAIGAGVALVATGSNVAENSLQLQNTKGLASSGERTRPEYLTDEGFDFQARILSVSIMKDAQDRICDPLNTDEIGKLVEKAIELEATHISLEMPIDSPGCGDSEAYNRFLVTTIREKSEGKLKLWHKPTALALKGNYGAKRDFSNPYKFIDFYQKYLLENIDLIEKGDAITPFSEADGYAGVNGFTCDFGSDQYCTFTSKELYNEWLQKLVTKTRETLDLNVEGGEEVPIICCGFNGWTVFLGQESALTPQTVDLINRNGALSLDHYVKTDLMEHNLRHFESVWPGVKLAFGEIGTIPEILPDGDPVNGAHTLSRAIMEHSETIIGVDYWQFGPQGLEEKLVTESGSVLVNTPTFEVIHTLYKDLKEEPIR